MRRLATGSDHAGVSLRLELIQEALSRGMEVSDLGPAPGQDADYPVYGELVGRRVADGKADLGLLICGTGVGISLAANRVAGVRAVVCSDPYTARLSRQHNNTNILALGARVVTVDEAKSIFAAWIDAEFEGGRHQRRLDRLDQITP